MRNMMRIAALLLLTCGACFVHVATEECTDLVGQINDCPAFIFAEESSDRLALGALVPEVKAQGGQQPLVKAFQGIDLSEFDEKCCNLLRSMNESRCFCQEDVVAGLQSEIEDELLAFTIFTAGSPNTCGGPIWAAIDTNECRLLGRNSDASPGFTKGECRELKDILRDPTEVNEPINLLEEALDAAGLLVNIRDFPGFTLLAPTNSAFENFADSQGVSVSDLLGDEEMLEELLKKHLIPRVLLSTDILEPSKYDSAEGSTLQFDVLETGGVSVEGIPISQADISTCYGVIHVIPAVLTESVSIEPRDGGSVVISSTSQTLEKMEEGGQDKRTTKREKKKAKKKTASMKIKKEKSVAGERVEEKSKSACGKGERTVIDVLTSFEEAFGMLLEEIDETDGIRELLDGEGPVTIFAPINSEIEIERIINGSRSKEDTQKTVNRLVVEGDIPGSDLISDLILVSIGGDELEVTVDSGTVYINGVRVRQADIEACNGRIHIVKSSLPLLNDAESEESEDADLEPLLNEADSEESEDADLERSEQKDKEEAENTRTRTGTGDGKNSSKKMKKKKKRDAEEGAENKGKNEKNVEKKTKSSSSSMDQDPCSCSDDGISAGVDTGRIGCAQHFLDMKDNTLFCFVKDPFTCQGAQSGVELFALSSFFPALFRTCDESEVDVLPLLPNLVTETMALDSVWKLFVDTGLDELLEGEGPYTVFLPSRFAVEEAIFSTLIDGTSPDKEQLKKIMENHIVDQRFTLRDLRFLDSVSTVGGNKLDIRTDGYGGIWVGGNARVELANLLASNGVAHVVDSILSDGVIEERKIPLEEACLCAEDGVSGGIETGRPGCDVHVPGDAAFCYVKHPEACHFAIESYWFPGAKWLSCRDPCSCSRNEYSGGIYTGIAGCGKHARGSGPFCYVEEPSRCRHARQSVWYPHAAWRWCSRPTIYISLGSTSDLIQDDPCDCSEDGVSGGVQTGRPGCGRFGVFFAPFDICYVKQPSQCPSIPSFRHWGAAWRRC